MDFILTRFKLSAENNSAGLFFHFPDYLISSWTD